ncbi:MAG: bifunctional riboflavin kinase/FAD synthetase [Proteobacteria bacterium]|nr:bifunctional riboflavin kinase/FAD synthetase [Pseudomonadota bacterium]
MRLFRHTDQLPPDARGSVAALGNFDGVHLGHRAVIAEAGRIARRLGAPHAVLTLEPHPRSVFRPDDPPFRLTPFRPKTHAIQALGVDLLFVLGFDLEFARLEAEAFVRTVLVEGLALRHAVAGYDFVFGHRRRGNARLLARLAGECGVGFTEVAPRADDSGRVFSSTLIREALVAGNPRAAAEMLGRPWEIEGRVEAGESRGAGLGFPTANLGLGEYLEPAHGVYAVRAGVDAGGTTLWHDGVANLGRRPTFGGGRVLLEVHLFDFAGDLYGCHIRVRLIDYVRPERRFAGRDALVAQIRRDCARARALLAAAQPAEA